MPRSNTKKVERAIYYRGDDQFMVRVRKKGADISETFLTLEEAIAFRNETEAKLLGGRRVAIQKDQKIREVDKMSLNDGLVWYKNEIMPLTPKSVRHKKTLIKYWQNHPFSEFSLTGLSSKDLIEWRKDLLDEREEKVEDRTPLYSPQTIIHRLNLLSHLYNQLADHFEIDLYCPVTKSCRPKNSPARMRRVYRGSTEEKKLFKACEKNTNHPWLIYCVKLALETCLRRGEIYQIDWNEIDLDSRFPSIILKETKTESPRTIPLWPTAVQTLEEYSQIHNPDKTGKLFPINNTTMITREFGSMVKSAGIEDLRFHDLRHEATSRLFEETDLRDIEIMSITGHKTSAMLNRYTHLQAKKLSSYERHIS